MVYGLFFKKKLNFNVINIVILLNREFKICFLKFVSEFCLWFGGYCLSLLIKFCIV